jgi:hypothetical protein
MFEKKMNALSDEVRNLRREQAENAALLQGLSEQLKRLTQGGKDNPLAHAEHIAMPVKMAQLRFDRVGEAWAALSLSLLLFGIVTLIFLDPRHLLAELAIITLVFITLEAFLRGAFIQTLGQITALLAMICGIILVFHFGFWIVIGGLLAIAFFLMLQRLREMTG